MRKKLFLSLFLILGICFNLSADIIHITSKDVCKDVLKKIPQEYLIYYNCSKMYYASDISNIEFYTNTNKTNWVKLAETNNSSKDKDDSFYIIELVQDIRTQGLFDIEFDKTIYRYLCIETTKDKNIIYLVL